MRALLIALTLLATPANAQLSIAPVSTSDLSQFATRAQLDAMIASLPSPATSAPPGVSDSGSIGTLTTQYALANHTHASKARKGRPIVPASGTLAVNFVGSDGTTPSPFGSGVIPLCVANAEATAGDTNVVNVQLDGPPTNTGMAVRVTRTQQSVVSLIGLTVLSVPTQIATRIAYICVEP